VTVDWVETNGQAAVLILRDGVPIELTIDVRARDQGDHVVPETKQNLLRFQSQAKEWVGITRQDQNS
jgi:hypothetical protein